MKEKPRLMPLRDVAPAVQAEFPADDSVVWNLSLEDVESGTGKVLRRVECRVGELGSTKSCFDTRHVLYGKLRPYLNKVVVPDSSGVATSELIPLRPDPTKLDREYLAFFLRSPQFVSFAKSQMQGANLPRISMTVFWDRPVPCPSLTEQRRVVVRVSDALERLNEITMLTDSCRQDVEALRYASVREIMERLRKNHSTVTIGQLVANDRTAMRSGPFGSAMKHHEFVPKGNLVIGIANVQENRFDSVRKWMVNDAKYEQMRRYEVTPGDVLVTIMGTIGRTCVVPDDIGKAITSKHVYRIRLPRKKVSPHFISYILNFDPDARRQLFGTATGGVMPGLNGTKLRDLHVVLPALEVQQETAEQLDEIHNAITEMTVPHDATDTAALRQAILREAFAGNL